MTTKSPTTRRKAKVRTAGDTNLVLLVSAIPHSAPAFRYCDQFIRNPVGQLCIPALFRGIDDPLDSSTTALTQIQRMGDLHRSTTTCDTLLLANAEKRSHRVNDQCEVKDRVERQLGSGRTADKRSARVRVGRRRGAEVVQDDRHVLDSTEISPEIGKKSLW